MKKIVQLFIFVAILLTASAANAQESHFIHTVSKGQTLYSISRMYQTTVKDLIDLNPECIANISVGQKIKIPQVQTSNSTAQNSDSVIYHTIKQGETLYRLGKMYNITPQEICAANPGLSISNFRSGEVIMIPLHKKIEARPAPQGRVEPERTSSTPDTVPIRTIHKVKKGETVYRIAHTYGITVDELRAANPQIVKDKLKKNSLVKIPYSKAEIESMRRTEQAQSQAQPQSNAEIFERAIQERASQRDDNFSGIRVAVILPFMLDSYSPNEQGRMVEYYEGFLMAVEELKEQGYSFEINTYDSGNANSSLEPLLSSGELDRMDLIIGALYPSHNKQLADFAKRKEIPLVIPFTSKEDEIFRNPMVYVVNTMQSYFYSEVIDHFTVQFPNANVIFVSDSLNNKKEFVGALTEGLDARLVPHSTITLGQLIDSETNEATLKEIMKEGMDNVFIPTSSSEVTLGTMLPTLILLNNDTIDLPDYKLFGYPEWQIYAGNMRSQIYEVNTFFYASFFSHYTLPEASRFQNEYIRWYNRSPQNIYPRYGMLGYDTGYTFLLAISKYGNNMDININNLGITPVQTGFKFERVNNWGGMVNKKIYFVNYTPTFTIEKIDFDKR